MLKQAVIIAGGEGKRLNSLTGDSPKILVPILETSLLEFQIEYLKKNKIKKIHFCLGLGSEKILSKLEELDINFTYTVDDKPLGTYGALQNAYRYLDSEFFILFGDIVLDYDISFGYKNFKSKNSDLHLILRQTNHPEDSDIVKIDKYQNVLSLSRHDNLEFPYEPLGNTAVFFSKKNIIESELKQLPKDIFKDFINNKIKDSNVTSEITLDFIRDIGTVDRYNQEIDNFSRYLKHEKKYVFVDRDGTLINNRGDDNDISKFELKEGSLSLLSTLQENNFKIIMISNQPSIAKGFCTYDDVISLNAYLQHELIRNNLKPLDGIYFCPHHPEKGFTGEIKSLKIKCNCRKPNTGLVLKALEELNILSQSYFFIGDTLDDYYLAKKFNSEYFIVESELTESEKFKNLNVKTYKNLDLINKEFVDNLI